MERIERGDEDRTGILAGEETAAAEPDPDASPVDPGLLGRAGPSASPSGIDDPANVNPYQGRPGTNARGGGGG